MSPVHTMRRVWSTRNPRQHFHAAIRARFWDASRRRFAGVCAALLLALAPLRTDAAQAQPVAIPPAPSAPVAAVEPALRPDGVPTPAAAMRAFRAVDSWVRALEAPKETPEGGAPLVACAGASVQLRLEGKLIARGSAYTLDSAQQKDVILRAARAAITEARSRMPGDRDALFEERAKELAKSIIISLELAGTPIPIDLDDWSRAAQQVNPGVDGVAARIGDRVEAMFPVAMLSTQTEPAAALQGLTSKLGTEPGLGLLPLADLKKKHGVIFYRVPATHVAQTKPGGSGQFLHRGGVVFDGAKLDRAELVRWAEMLTAHLIARTPDLIAKHGTLNPIAGATDEAGLSEATKLQAIVTMALSRYPGISAAGREGWEEPRFKGTMTSLADTVTQVPFDSLGIPERAIVIGVRIRSDLDHWCSRGLVLPETARLRFEEQPALKDLYDDLHNVWKVDLDAHTRVLIAFAIAEDFNKAAGGKKGGGGGWENVPVHDVYGDGAPESALACMPWLGWATLSADFHYMTDADVRAHPENPELAFLQVTSAPENGLPSDEQPLAQSVALRNARDLLWRGCIAPESLEPPQRDLAGAFMSPVPGTLPSWFLARPLAFYAEALRDKRLTEKPEIARETARLLASLRFLRQLTVDENSAWMFEHPESALGGVRASPWDQRMPIEATAMTLIAVSETIHSLDELAKREAAPKAQP